MDTPRRHFPVELNGNFWVGELFVPPNASGVLICLGIDCPTQTSTRMVQDLRLASLPLRLRENRLDSDGEYILSIVDWVNQHALTRNKPVFIVAGGSVNHTHAALSAAIKYDERIAGLILINAIYDDESLRLLERVQNPMFVVVKDKQLMGEVLPARFHDLANVQLLSEVNNEALADWLLQFVRPPQEEETPP